MPEALPVAAAGRRRLPAAGASAAMGTPIVPTTAATAAATGLSAILLKAFPVYLP